MKLTAATIRALELPSGVQDKTFFDDDLAGFGVRVRAGGSRSYVVQYKVGSKNCRLPLGSVAALDPGKARSTAKDLLAAVRLGRDPAGEKLEQRQKADETFGAFLPKFLARQRARLKPRSMVEVDRFLTNYAKPLHGLPVTSIDRRLTAVHLTRIGDKHGPGAANRFRAALSTFFTWLGKEGLIEANPVLNTNKAPEAGERNRVLSDAEIKAIWKVAGDDQYGAIIKLLVLTGCRRDEIGGLCWSEVDFDSAVIALPPARTKNGQEHRVSLAPIALEILRQQPRREQPDGQPRDLIFGRAQRGYSGWSKSQRELNERLVEAGTPIESWWLHDLRRSLSTTMHDRLGVMPHIVEAVLNHISGHRSGVAGTYNLANYDGQKAVALRKWSDHIEALVTGKRPTAVVKQFRRRK